MSFGSLCPTSLFTYEMMNSLIIDTDAGIDDAQALLLALSSSSINILGITCVAGNVPLDLVVPNVCACLDICDIPTSSSSSSSQSRQPVPVYRGATTPLLGPHAEDASYWHGTDGLGNTGFGLCSKVTDRVVEGELSVNALFNMCMQWKASTQQQQQKQVRSSITPTLTLLALGPLTNIALSLRVYPELVNLIDRVVVMGGAYQAMGNASLVSEFNVWQDPESAHIVLSTFRHVQLVTWELTMRNGLDDAFMKQWLECEEENTETLQGQTTTTLSSEVAGAGAGATLSSSSSSYPYASLTRRKWLSAITQHLLKMTEAAGAEYTALGFLIPDPLAAAIAVRPDCVLQSKKRRVVVELSGSETRGMTIVDWDGKGLSKSRVGANVEIIESVDMTIVKELLLQSVSGKCE